MRLKVKKQNLLTTVILGTFWSIIQITCSEIDTNLTNESSVKQLLIDELNKNSDSNSSSHDSGSIIVNQMMNENNDKSNSHIIDAKPTHHNSTSGTRNARNVVFIGRSWLDSLAEGTPCLSSTGTFGRCTSFRTCYPNVKQSGGNIFGPWYLARNGQCSYFNSGGQQFLGICCTEPERPVNQHPPPNSEEFEDDDDLNEINDEFDNIDDDDRYNSVGLSQWPAIGVPTHSTYRPVITSRRPVYMQWPPPIPTHPPNHAAPTHPPFSQDRTTKSPWQTSTTKAPWQTSTTKAPWQTWPTTTKAPWQTWPTTTKSPWQTSTTKSPWQTSTTKAPWQTTSTRKPWWTSTTSKPYTTTRFPAQWPPPLPTHPPSHQPAQPAPPSNEIQYDEELIIPQATCGTKNGGSDDQERIVGGSTATPNEWPWIVVMFKDGRQFCGGSIIDKTHILTAAHCVSQLSAYDVARITVHLGDHDIRNSNEVKHVVRKVKRVVRHKGFDFSHLHNDVAVLTMDQPIQFTNTIRPICLPTVSSAKSYRGMLGTVAGWGSLRENGPQPSVLQKVTIPIWSNSDCARKYGNAAPAGIADSMICAGQSAKDSCSGDSGGPMMVNEGGDRWVQVGIVSWGIGCGKGQYPGVYSRVTSFLPWIAKNLH